MKPIIKSDSIELEIHEIKWMRNKLFQKFCDKKKLPFLKKYEDDASSFWIQYKRDFSHDFQYVTGNCGIPLNGSKIDGQKISEKYLARHLVSLEENKYQTEYLRRFIFYVTGHINDTDFITFFDDAQISKDFVSPALRYLEGYWVSYNRNLEAQNYARCYYRFYIEENRMKIEREAYISEKKYHGEVIVQGDASYLFHLKGEVIGRSKFIVSDPGMVRPFILKCISSAFDLGSGDPIFAKEILVKLAEGKEPELNGGHIETKEEALSTIVENCEKLSIARILHEMEAYLGDDEIPFFSIPALSYIKKKHLKEVLSEKIKDPKIIKKQSVYVHFSKLGANTSPYKRDVVKYSMAHASRNLKAFKRSVDVFDEYTYVKICQYNHEETQKHVIKYEAENAEGVVDIQSLFPIVEEDQDNDLKEPSLRASELIMDANSETFVSTASFINDFSKKKRVSLNFNERTLKSEIIFDFGSIEAFKELNIFIDEISFHYNDPDERGTKVISVNPKNPEATKGYKLTSVNKALEQITFDDTLNIDKENPKIFAVSVDFPVEENDFLYIHFNLDL